jgi:hypothetical protein
VTVSVFKIKKHAQGVIGMRMMKNWASGAMPQIHHQVKKEAVIVRTG